MIEEIIFTVVAFVLFVYILLLKMIKKNDTTYLTILGIQALGILLNLLKIYFLCIIIPIAVFLLEAKNINVSEILRVVMAQSYLWLGKAKKAKKVLIDLVSKYPNSYIGHKMLANLYEKEGGMRKAIDEYVQVLDIKKNDYDSYYKISVLLNDLGKKDEATDMLKTLLKNRPQMYEASKILRRHIFRKKRI